MLVVDDAPPIAAEEPCWEADRFDFSAAGIFVAAGATGYATLAQLGIPSESLLLAKERGLESWHECRVTKVDGDLTLVWPGLPDSEVFTRRMWQLGIVDFREVKPC